MVQRFAAWCGAVSLLLCGASSYGAPSTEVAMEIAWADAKGRHETINVSFAAAAVRYDDQQALELPLREAHQAGMTEVHRLRASSLPEGSRLEVAWAAEGRVEFLLHGGETEEASTVFLGALREEYDAAFADYLQRRGYQKDVLGAWSPNYDALVARYTPLVAPLAAALTEDIKSPIRGVEELLQFVQSIPFEQTEQGTDVGYRHPLSVVMKNRGDCDSKAVLFLALVHAQYPQVDLGLVYHPDHLSAALALPRDAHANFVVDGKGWAIAEPVGPHYLRLGEAVKQDVGEKLTFQPVRL